MFSESAYKVLILYWSNVQSCPWGAGLKECRVLCSGSNSGELIDRSICWEDHLRYCIFATSSSSIILSTLLHHHCYNTLLVLALPRVLKSTDFTFFNVDLPSSEHVCAIIVWIFKSYFALGRHKLSIQSDCPLQSNAAAVQSQVISVFVFVVVQGNLWITMISNWFSLFQVCYNLFEVRVPNKGHCPESSLIAIFRHLFSE